MRNLQTRDFFKAARLIKNLKIKDKIKNFTLEVGTDSKPEEVGFDFLFMILGECSDTNAEKEIYSFLAGPLEIDPEEVEKMDFLELIEKVMKVADIERWKSFFTQIFK